MTDFDKRADPKPDQAPQAYPAEEVRQGRIVLDSPRRRAVFVTGLVASVVLTCGVVFVLYFVL